MNVQQVDETVLANGGIVQDGFCGDDFFNSSEWQPVGGEWAFAHVASRGMGNFGQVVALPLTRRARRIRRQGVVDLWTRAGLTQGQAEALYCAKAHYKFELVSQLVEVLKDPHEVEAYLAHPCNYGPGSGRGAWASRWEGVVVHHGGSVPRETELAKMVQAVVSAAWAFNK